MYNMLDFLIKVPSKTRTGKNVSAYLLSEYGVENLH